MARFDRPDIRYSAVYRKCEFHEGEALTQIWAAAARGNPTPRMTSAKLKHAYPPWGDELAADADCALDPGAPKARTDATAKIRGRIILVAKRLT